MRYLLFFLCCSFLLVHTGCSNDKKDDIKNNPVQKTGKKDIEPEQSNPSDRPKDSINKKNAVAFLKIYGEQNKENKLLIKTRLGDIKIQL